MATYEQSLIGLVRQRFFHFVLLHCFTTAWHIKINTKAKVYSKAVYSRNVIITVVYTIFRLIGYYLWNAPKTITCVKGKGIGVHVRAMKAYSWCICIASLILNLGARRRWVVRITARPHPLIRKLGGPQNWSGRS